MNDREFIYWLQGFLELTKEETLNEEQMQVIRDHIAMVLTKVTPERNIKTNAGKEETTIDIFVDKQKYERYDPRTSRKCSPQPTITGGVILCSDDGHSETYC